VSWFWWITVEAKPFAFTDETSKFDWLMHTTEGQLMTQTVEIDQGIYNALKDSFGEAALKERLNDILLSAVESRLQKYNQEILAFEEKYGTTFQEFDKMWDDGKIVDRHSETVESDFIDWEICEMEKRELIQVISKMNRAKAR
jgi:hypothetical protein